MLQVSVDNFTFKLFYKWSVSLFIAGSVVVVSSQFFGEPISCETVSGGRGAVMVRADGEYYRLTTVWMKRC